MPCDLSHPCFDCPKLGMHLDKRGPFDAYLMYYSVSAAKPETLKAVA